MIYNEPINYLCLILCFESAYGGLTPMRSSNYLTFPPEILFVLLIWIISVECEIIRLWSSPGFARKN